MGMAAGAEPQPGAALPNAPAGFGGLAPQQVAAQFGELSSLGGSRSGFSLGSDPTNPDNLLNLSPDAAGPVERHVTVVCPKCGHNQSISNKDDTCERCNTKLQQPEADMATDESPFVGNNMSQSEAYRTLIEPTRMETQRVREAVLNLADSTNDDSDISTGGGDVADQHPASVMCPSCEKLNAWDRGTCLYCGTSLDPAKQQITNMDADQEATILHLSAEQLTGLDLADNAGQRQQWAKEGKALPDGSWPIPNVAYLKKAIQAFPGRAKGNVGKIKAWILKRAKALSYTGDDLDRVKGVSDGTNAAQPEHNASIVTLKLDHTQGENGLIWKVLCKTGTLALSPGPGQVDVDKPLNLTADLFKATHAAYADGAFEHVTIPETHANGTLENCGTVQHLDVLTKDQALADARLSQATKSTLTGDSADTLYMLGGLHFTDPKAREKAANGSILNCSVGLKFNYRRKRDGKLFPVALEHVALTNQPWVDGLGTFGGATMSQPFDQEQLPVWDGVFVPRPAGYTVGDVVATLAETGMLAGDGGASSNASLSQSEEAGGLSSVKDDAQTGGGATPAIPAPGEVSLESILASQQATIERLQAETASRDQALELAQNQLKDQGYTLHEAQTNERVAELQRMGVPPAVLVRYKALRLAAYHSTDGVLQLSVKQGENTVTKAFSPVEQAEYLLAAIPLGEADGNVIAITSGLAKAESLALAQDSMEKVEATAAQKADAIERDLHPERYDSEGKRLARDKRGAA